MVAINIPADGLALAVLKAIGNDFFSHASCKKAVCEYIGKHIKANSDIILLNICYRRSLTPSNVFDSVLYNIQTDKNGLPLCDDNGNPQKYISPENNQEVTHYFDSFFSLFRKLLQHMIRLGEDVGREISKHYTSRVNGSGY